MNLAHSWGQQAKSFGPNSQIPADKLPAEAAKRGLKTPSHLAQGAILAELSKGDVSRQQTAMFLKAFEAGAAGAGKPSVEFLKAKTSDDPKALIPLVTAPQLKKELTAKIDKETAQQEGKIKAGLGSFDELARISADTDAPTREALVNRLNDKAKAYGQAALITTKADGTTPDQPIGAAFKKKLDAELAANPTKAQGVSLLKRIEAFGNTKDDLIPPADRKPFESMTGLYEASVFSAVQDKKITIEEAETLLTTYRAEIGDKKNPAIVDGKVNYSTGVLKHFEKVIVPALFAGALTPEAPAVAADVTRLSPDQQRHIAILKAAIIWNDGIANNDKDAATLLGVDTSQISKDIQNGNPLPGRISRPLAREALAIPIPEDGNFDAETKKKIDDIGAKFVAALKGEKVDVKEVKAAPNGSSLKTQLEGAIKKAEQTAQPAK